MNDLGALMKIAPYAGSYMAAQNNVLGQNTERLQQEKLRQVIAQMEQENMFNRELHPLNVDKLRNQNEFDRSVKLPRGLEELAQERYKTQFTGATQSGAIDATNAGNAKNQAVANAEVGNVFQQTALRIGANLDKIPPVMRMQHMREAFAAEKINPDSPMAQQMLRQLQRMDPETYPKFFQDIAENLGKTMAKADPRYQQEMDKAKSVSDSHKYTADRHLEGVKYAADAKLEAAQLRMSQMATSTLDAVRAGKLNYEKGATTFEILAEFEQDPAKKAQYQKISKILGAEALKKAGAAGGPKPNLDALGIPSAAAPETGMGGAAQPPASAASGVTKSGTKYKVLNEK